MKRWKSSQETIRIAWSALVVFLLPLILPAFAFSQLRLDTPTANLGVANPVPDPLIKQIALVKSKETWGPGVLGDPIPLADLNGDLIVYMFPYYIGGDRFPTYQEILQGIKQGRELRNYLKDSQTEQAREMFMKMDRGTVVQHKREVIITNSDVPRRPEMEPVRPDGSPSRRVELEEIRQIEQFAARKAIGADEFGTILVSITYDRFPVLAYFHYLPPYYINFDLALEKAEQMIGQGALLRTIYFLGLEGQYFEFANNRSSLLLNSKTLEPTTPEALTISRSPAGHTPSSDQISSQDLIIAKDKIKADLTQAWDKITAEAGKEGR